MCANWKQRREGFDPALLVGRLEALRVISGHKVSFRGHLWFEDVVTVLESAIKFRDPMTEHDRRGILSDALFSAARSGPLTKSSLIGEVKRGEHDFLRRPNQEFVLISSLSVTHFPELTKAEVPEHRIAFHRHVPTAFNAGYEEAKEQARASVFGDYPDPTSPFRHYTAVTISTQGRSEAEAGLAALAALNLQRGFWNLALNQNLWDRPINQRRKPVNTVLLGPVHSLHHPNGELVPRGIWFDNEYVEPTPTTKLNQRWDRVVQYEENMRSLLHRSSYRSQLEEFIRDYVRALDGREWTSAFVQLWGLLERLTGTGHESYEQTVKRGSPPGVPGSGAALRS